ncbi:spheroidene monooxygenase [Streptomyces sp. NPDC003077]|uniref:spheroidene monooxygenase n=1 Tax=Streptomyces sp. NPDC003077 TaxID=3154443 RepID=UPI0033B92D8A
MIVSVHLAEVGIRSVAAILRDSPRPGGPGVPGLRAAHTTLTGVIAAGLPRVTPGRVALVAAWEDDDSLDRFLADHPLAHRLAHGWRVRLQPLRVSGSWSGMPITIPSGTAPAEDDEPVAVLTLGELRLRRAAPFLRANSQASGRAASSPAMVASFALARPPRFVGTFSLWSSARLMRQYAYGTSEPEHISAVRSHQAVPFHHEAAFVRFRPYGAHGTLDGREPLTAAATA